MGTILLFLWIVGASGAARSTAQGRAEIAVAATPSGIADDAVVPAKVTNLPH